jgi:hypothetical protein
MHTYTFAGPAFGWKPPPPAATIASSFDFGSVRPRTTAECEAGISVWQLTGSTQVTARIRDDTSDGRFAITALTVYDRVAADQSYQQPGAPPPTRLAAVRRSQGEAVPVRRGQAVGIRLRYTGGGDAVRRRHTAIVEVVAEGGVITGLPAGASGTPTDSTIAWSPANQWGIQVSPYQGEGEVTDPLGGPWLAGHVQCALVLEGAASLVLAGTNGGGVWVIPQPVDEIQPGQLEATPLTDNWADTPFINSLCQGPDDAEHIYAAASGLKRSSLRETSLVGGSHTIYQWDEIALPPELAVTSGGNPPPSVTQVVVTRDAPQRIVISTTIGVYWALVPAPGGIYDWTLVTTMADGSPFAGGSFSAVAVGVGDRIIVAGASTLFWGDWSAQGLTMNRAGVQFGAEIFFPIPMGWTSLASAPGEPTVQYAAVSAVGNASYKDGPPMLGLFKSTNNGQAWASLATEVTSLGTSLPQAAEYQGSYNNCVAVSPWDAGVVAVGWQRGHFLSTDGGATFEYFNAAGLHVDVHGLYFDPWQKEGTDYLYVCSDGGICLNKDHGASFESRYNRNLADLQCYATYVTRDFYGTIDASSQYIAAGIQDNSNVYCLLPPWDTDDPQIENAYTFTTPWVQIGGGDGGCVAVLPTAPSLYGGAEPGGPNIGGVTLCSNEAGHAGDAMTVFPTFPPEFNGPNQTIPVLVWGIPDAAGIGAPVLVRVPEPAYANADGQLMYAVCAPWGALSVCGLFANPDGTDLQWEEIGSVASSEPSDSVGALAPLPDGTQILVATGKGTYGLITPQPGQVTPAAPVPFDAEPWQSLSPRPVITRIVFPAPDVAFAAYNWSTGGIVLGCDGNGWQPAAGQPPVGQYHNDGIYGLAVSKGFAADGGLAGMLFASTNDGVYVSRDRAGTWLDCSTGLPACPQCADIQCADGPVETATGVPLGGSYLYVGTWGRSVWMASLKDAIAGPPVFGIGGH